MTEKNKLINYGVYLARHLGPDNVRDFLKIAKFNDLDASSWTRANNSGISAQVEAQEKTSAKLWTKAQEIANRHHWKLDAPGLFWTLTTAKGITIYQI